MNGTHNTCFRILLTCAALSCLGACGGQESDSDQDDAGLSAQQDPSGVAVPGDSDAGIDDEDVDLSGDDAGPDGEAAAQDEEPVQAANDAAATTDPACETGCALVQTLGCARQPALQRCLQGCTETLAGTCAEQHRARVDCLATLSADDYTCSQHGIAKPVAGACDEEIEAVIECVRGR